MCERCEPREVNLEITLDEFSDEGYQYYLSLLRGTLQIRQTDTVYVLRDIPMTPDKGDPETRKHTYETIGRIDYADCDIFRVERLWKDDTGKRFVFGHHYLRPHETYHEPTRKFYPNEVVRVPLYEVVPIELIIDRCWVLDPTTYCKGRPVDSVEEHVYICELRVDKSARLFSKISKQSNPVCTKSYAFRKFKQKLKISKSYAVRIQYFFLSFGMNQLKFLLATRRPSAGSFSDICHSCFCHCCVQASEEAQTRYSDCFEKEFYLYCAAEAAAS